MEASIGSPTEGTSDEGQSIGAAPAPPRWGAAGGLDAAGRALDDGFVTRIDYYDDPEAPPANSLVPSVTAAVRDEDGRLLLIHKIDNDRWALPGGAMELGESVADAAVREVEEETGLRVEVTGLVGIYTDPGHGL